MIFVFRRACTRMRSEPAVFLLSRLCPALLPPSPTRDQRKYDRVLRKKDRQIEAGKRVTKENEALRIANAELKALNEMQVKADQISDSNRVIAIVIVTVIVKAADEALMNGRRHHMYDSSV